MKATATVKMSALMVIALLAVTACGCGKKAPVEPKMRADRVEAKTHLLNAKSFDLATVVALIKDGKVDNFEQLEKKINDPDTGINNVDLDNDKQIDFIGVNESKTDSGSLDFVAYKSSKPDEQPTTIASVKITQDQASGQVAINAGYPDYVEGHQENHYNTHTSYGGGGGHGGMSMGDALFMGMMFNTMRPRYYGYGIRPYYRPYPVMMGSTMQSRRTSYRTTSRVSSVSRSTRPKNYNIKSANKTRSKMKAQQAKSNKLKDRSGKSKSFKARSTNKTRSKASAFGARKSSSRSQPKAKPAPRRSRPKARRSSPRRSRSRGRRR